MSPIKVLAIAPDSITNPTGGLGVQWKEIYNRLNGKIDYYVVSQPDPIENNKYIGVKHPMPRLTHGGVNTILGNTSYFAAALKFPKPDIIHAMDWSVYFAGVCLAEHYNIPLVVSMQLSPVAMSQCGIFNCANFNTVDGRALHDAAVEIEKYGLAKCDKVVHVSRGYAEKYFKPFAHKAVVIPNGIDLNKWQETTKIIFPGEGKYKVVYIGRFTEMKAVRELLTSDIPEEIDLIFIGAFKGGDIQTINLLKKKVAEVKNIHYIGPLYEQDKINALISADAIIMPSTHEPFGIVALEALASKSILLSSRIDGLGDYLNDFNSIYCGSKPESISKALRDFLQLTLEEKEELINNGIKTCKKYNWDNICNEYLDLYYSMIKINHTQ